MTLEDHIKHLRWVLSQLRTHKLYAKPEKCQFHCTEISYLGYDISPEGIKMQHKKVDTVFDWPQPSNRKDIQRFLGFSNYYRKFIKGFSKLAKPLTQLTSQSKPFIWTKEASTAFEFLKTCFSTAPILRFPDATLP
ncbi:uncharacterized protein LOC128666925 [Bombina bombina]|uniref:uncharacterized protein LOC128666925 n=1 Tax=Bombina bombina TaxID=8345 RepID=UPI00235B2F24|nr:uncharacterized protein LOC128666925 [Bombina bombina]